MTAIEYDKLVRDNIPTHIQQKGESVFTRSLIDAAEKEMYAVRKIQEELGEFLSNPSAEEAGDLMEILNTLFRIKGLSAQDVETARQEKLVTKGGFEQWLVLEKTVSHDQ